MKNILILGSFMLSSFLFAQNEAKQLTPKWEKGVITEYKGSYSYTGSDENNDDVRTHHNFDSNFEIVQEEANHYLIRSLVPNIVILDALDLANNGKADFSPYESVNLFYKYNKANGKIELLNWENLVEIYTEAKADMRKFSQYYPQKQMKLEIMFKSLDLTFANQEMITNAYLEQMNWYTSFFNKNFVLNQSFTSSTKLINPFFNDETLKVSAKNTVNGIDTKAKSFSYTKDFVIKDSYYKSELLDYLKDRESESNITEKEKAHLDKLSLVTYQPTFIENHTINYETTLPVSFKIEYKLEEKTNSNAVRTFKKMITLYQKK